MAWAQMIIKGVANTLSASAKIEQGDAAMAEAEMSAEAKANDAQQYMKQAQAARAEGTREASAIRQKTKEFKSDTQAAMAASGGVSDDAGAIERFGEIETVSDFAKLTSIYNAENRALESEYAADMALHDAKGDIYRGKMAKRQSRIAAGATFLGGAADAAGSASSIKSSRTTTTSGNR